ncbi:orotidine-5'-phosphate decarboxylase [Luteococcus sp. Sow4_B9]|uniref:orotidine-5'-phosphate decarboxylase n=1 Tax=Luteococcus sp. Sow4_B9 TaxID=3438792 RepID=UPI003F9743A9
MTYAERLARLTAERGALCVGIDPHPQILAAWGLDDDVAGLEACARGMVEAIGAEVAVFKPQSAFYEVYGSAGIAVLERVLEDIRQAGALSILDVKRGDIGSTMAGYARAYLSDDSSLRADAVTLSPYLGFESLRPAIDLAHQTERGLYLLARTSNPEGGDVQLATATRGGSVSQMMVDLAAQENTRSGQNAIGLVVGGTHADPGCDVSAFNGSILVPGIGAQGGTVEGLRAIFGDATRLLLPSASRQVMQGGPSAEGLRAAFHSIV